jgi:hypothetical protein
VALSGAVVTARLHVLLPPGIHLESMTHLPGTAVVTDPAKHQLIVEAYRHAIATTFFTGSALAALAFVTVLALPEIPLRAREKVAVDAE